MFKIGLEEYEKNNIDSAIEYFDKSIDKDPDNPNPYNSRGTIKIFNGDTSGALYDYSMAVELCMKKGEHAVFPQAYYNRGVLYNMLGEPNKAINDLNISIRQDNNCSECYFNRGLVHSKLGLSKEAYEDFSQAYELNN